MGVLYSVQCTDPVQLTEYAFLLIQLHIHTIHTRLFIWKDRVRRIIVYARRNLSHRAGSKYGSSIYDDQALKHDTVGPVVSAGGAVTCENIVESGLNICRVKR